MALKVLMLRKKLDEKKAALEAARAALKDLEKRETELEQDIEEAKTDEEKKVVEQAVNDFEKDKEKNQEDAKSLENEIESIEKEIGELERAQKATPATAKKRGGINEMEDEAKYTYRSEMKIKSRRRLFDTLPIEQRKAIVAQEDVKSFLTEIRGISKHRGLTNADLTVPVIMLDVIRDNIERYSKLINVVNMRQVAGEARQNIVGTPPEAVWTEMCASINELGFAFNQITVDGYKVAGYIPVCNSILEDSDINLSAEIIEMLSKSIGLALDKAILYGKGSSGKMPTGIVTRLAQSVKPSDYPSRAPEWQDLSTSNIIKMPNNLTDKNFFSEFILNGAKASSDYSTGNRFWAMSESTLAKIVSKALTFNASGAIVAQVNNTMPVIGGNIVTLNFMPDGDVIGGYGDMYLLAQRAGIRIDQSEHVMFIQDNTVFRAKARYDGMPIDPESFVAININNAEVTTTMEFEPDKANNTISEI